MLPKKLQIHLPLQMFQHLPAAQLLWITFQLLLLTPRRFGARHAQGTCSCYCTSPGANKVLLCSTVDGPLKCLL
eukprot:Skav231391  [mRNA]  locus=scaffold1456:1398:5329:+ [translate_table: standard]